MFICEDIGKMSMGLKMRAEQQLSKPTVIFQVASNPSAFVRRGMS
jgi:hypothetical protein